MADGALAGMFKATPKRFTRSSRCSTPD